MRRTAIISYARMPEDSLRQLRDGLSDLSIDIAAVASHAREETLIQGVLPDAAHYLWGAYRYAIPWTEPFDHELYETLLTSRKATALPIVERFGPFEGGSLEAENRAAHDFSRAQRILNTHAPDLVLFANQPESGLEYMLYVLARYYGLQTLMTRGGSFQHTRIVTTTLEDPVLTEEWKPHPSIIPICNLDAPGDELHPKTQEEIHRIRTERSGYVPSHVRDKLDGRRWVDALKALATQANSTKRLLHLLLNRADGPIFKKLLYDRYMRFAEPEIKMQTGPTVFFPLHYQPELTTMPLGGPFVNQIKAIKLLSDALPEDGRIYVKEHLSTFATRTQGNRNYRPKNYYDWLVRIPKVSLVRPSIPSEYLQASVDCTACITGTAGLEAMIRGYKVLVFGNATYLNGPGVYSVKQTALSTLLELKPESKNYDLNAANRFMQALDSISWHISDIPSETDERLRVKQALYVDALLAALAELHKFNRLRASNEMC